MATLYLDASALVKRIVREVESEALTALIEEAGHAATSVVADVELHRAVERAGGGARLVRQAGRALELVDLVPLDGEIVQAARSIGPSSLRTLDAIHLASARALGEAVDLFVAYDRRLADAARAAGLTVAAPGERP